jgi:hypothetical protein
VVQIYRARDVAVDPAIHLMHIYVSISRKTKVWAVDLSISGLTVIRKAEQIDFLLMVPAYRGEISES